MSSGRVAGVPTYPIRNGLNVAYQLLLDLATGRATVLRPRGRATAVLARLAVQLLPCPIAVERGGKQPRRAGPGIGRDLGSIAVALVAEKAVRDTGIDNHLMPDTGLCQRAADLVELADSE